MIPYSPVFDQTVLENLVQHDAVVQRYRDFFSLIDFPNQFKNIKQVAHFQTVLLIQKKHISKLSLSKLLKKKNI